MSLIIDRKYISVVSTKLEKFKQKKDYLWNFRCPLCGDSKKHKTKTRGFFYKAKSNTNMSFMCHNCGLSMSFGNFLKSFDPHLYCHYQMERYKEESHTNTPKQDFTLFKTQPVFARKSTLSIPSIASLNPNHSAAKYIASRKIPKDRWNDIYYADDFLKFCDDTFPDHGKKLIKEEPRIVIPFYDTNNELIGIQGRAILKDAKVRYITIKANDDVPKVYGMNRLVHTDPIYVVEGPFDSMFLDNCVATMDASLYSIVSVLGDDKDYVFVFDNEPRNKEVSKHITKTIKLGYKVCIWPTRIKEKDINDMILVGHDVKSIIDTHIYKDLTAELQFQQWKKYEV